MKKPSHPEVDLHLPEPLRWIAQPLMRHILLALAGYKVSIVGELPKEPSLLAAYPHGEHANSLLLPPQKIVYMAAADTWYTNILLQLATSAIVDTVPVVRESSTVGHRNRELKLQERVFKKRKKHLLVYPQGTRSGPVDSAYQLRQQLKGGVGFMARYHNVPTVPVGFVYPADYQPAKGGIGAWLNFKNRLMGSGRIVPVTVRIGEPIEPPPDGSKAARELFLAVLSRELFNLTR